jgi:hypothetical protein
MTATYEKIASTTASGSTDSITFSSITGSYTDLVLVINARNNDGADTVYMEFNSDTNTNYSNTRIEGNGSVASSYRQSNASNMSIGIIDTSNVMATIIVNINNYSNSNNFKTYIARGSVSSYSTRATVGTWRNNAAINAIKVYAGTIFVSGSTFTLYGIKAE